MHLVLSLQTEWITPTAAIKDSCGHSSTIPAKAPEDVVDMNIADIKIIVKVARTLGGPIYQYEFNWAKENDWIWFVVSIMYPSLP
jgi:hypothetical protein